MHIKNNKIVLFVLTALMLLTAQNGRGQSAFDYFSRNRNLSASNYSIYPDSIESKMTPPPAGKRPFYISHYGRHGSRYLNNHKAYKIPYQMLCKADSLDELTPIGQDVMHEMKRIIDDAEGRWGDLTGFGKQQQRAIARRMMQRFPEVFEGEAFIDARSTIVTRCILSMGSAVLQMSAMNPQLKINMSSSYHDMWYLNCQDKFLRDSMMTNRAQQAYERYIRRTARNPRLMDLLFVDSAYVNKYVDQKWLNYYLIKTALIQQNTHMSLNGNFLLDLFSYEELHQFWQNENAWWYIHYGPSPLNGGCQPYTQRYLLRRIIQEADSIMATDTHGASLRYGHETVVLPLVCLLNLNGYGYQTEKLEDLEEKGWWAWLVFPMASNLQFVFYRNGPDDDDVIFKVLLNEKEAWLPLANDIAPYYHWKDFKKYYLKRLDAYDSIRVMKRQSIHPHLFDHSEQAVGTGW